jgi:hypothetical protein
MRDADAGDPCPLPLGEGVAQRRVRATRSTILQIDGIVGGLPSSGPSRIASGVLDTSGRQPASQETKTSFLI